MIIGCRISVICPLKRSPPDRFANGQNVRVVGWAVCCWSSINISFSALLTAKPDPRRITKRAYKTRHDASWGSSSLSFLCCAASSLTSSSSSSISSTTCTIIIQHNITYYKTGVFRSSSNNRLSRSSLMSSLRNFGEDISPQNGLCSLVSLLPSKIRYDNLMPSQDTKDKHQSDNIHNIALRYIWSKHVAWYICILEAFYKKFLKAADSDGGEATSCLKSSSSG